MLLPDVFYSKVVNDERKCDWKGRVRPEARGVFWSEHICGGARMEVNFWCAMTPAWGRPYIPLWISKNTHPPGATKSSKLYMSMNCVGIFEM